MPIAYSIIEIFTNEDARYLNKPLYKAVVNYLREAKIAARCMVMRGVEAYYENGEIATQDILVISYNMPLKIELIVPSSELDRVLPSVEEMVTEGIVAVRKMDIYCHKIRKYFIPRHIRVRDMMTPSPKTVAVSSSLSDVVRLLLSSIFTGVPVTDPNDHPVGVISQSDLIYRANMPIRLSILAESEPDKLDAFLMTLTSRTAEEIMTQPAITIKDDKMLTDAVAVMIEHEVKRLIVVDQTGKIVGILSRIDIFQGITRESPDWNGFRKRKIFLSNLQFVSDIMRRDTISVSPDTPVEDVVHLIDTNDLQCVAVVDVNGNFSGMIFDHDILSLFSDHGFSLWEYLSSKISFRERGHWHKESAKKLREKTASDVMKTDLITIFEEAGIDEAITLITKKKIKRLPVLDKNGKFKGLINRESLLRATLKQT